jgi:hypothetical protein
MSLDKEINFVMVARSLNDYKTQSCIMHTTQFTNNLTVIYSQADEIELRTLMKNGINCIDEKELSNLITFQEVRKKLPWFLKQRTGWYLQQYIKLAASAFLFQGKPCFIVDSDCFLNENLNLEQDALESRLGTISHAPRIWNELTEYLLGVPKNLQYSFVTENLLIQPYVVEKLLSHVSKDFEVEHSLESQWKYFKEESFRLINYLVIKHIAITVIKGYKIDFAYFDALSEYDLIGNFILYNSEVKPHLVRRNMIRYNREMNWIFDQESDEKIRSIGIEG